MSFIPAIISSIHTPFPYRACWIYLEEKGQIIFGPHFSLHPQDGEIILKLLAWALKDEALAAKHQISLHKGILLSGPVGCGKSSLMQLLRWLLPPAERYPVKPCREVAYEFGEEGFPVIGRYSKQSFHRQHGATGETAPRTFCFDDLGREPAVQHFGNAVNVMTELLLARYDYFTTHRMLTHLTTNLDSAGIEERYGRAERSRCCSLFNLIAFDKAAPTNAEGGFKTHLDRFLVAPSSPFVR